MALQLNKLSTIRYTKPGTYLKQFFRPQTNGTTTFIPIPTYIGRGDKYLYPTNVPIIRGFISSELLDFTESQPYRATLVHKADGDKSNATLLRDNGETVDPRLWSIVQDGGGNYIGIQLVTSAYNPASSYIFSYQSVDKLALDDTGIDDLETVIQAGYRENSNDFSIIEDFTLETVIGHSLLVQ